MTERPMFDPFAVLAAAKGQKALAEPPKTFAELSQTTDEAFDERNQRLADNFAAFAAFAGGLSGAAGSRQSLYLERKKDFSLSLQSASHGCSRGWLASSGGEERIGAAPLAKAAILRSESLSDCKKTINRERVSAKVSQDEGRERAEGAPREDAAAKVFEAQLAFDERAAFLEYECGLNRAEAEAQTRRELEAAKDTPVAWTAGLARLNPHRAPCPDYRGDEWSRVLANAHAFLAAFGAQAETLGWRTHELFGVHPEVGTVRPDCCGALTLGVGGPVRLVTADEIRFGHLTHRRLPSKPQGVPIWEFGR